MLCPEVWKFSPPDSCNKETTGCIQSEGNNISSPLKNFYFGHLVSIVLPSNNDLQSITKSFINDSEYYKVLNVAVGDLCSTEFINNFIRKGSVTAISINTEIDIGNCVCITPEGVLILSINRKSYQELGLHGEVSQFCSNRKDRYIVQLNLKDDSFTANKALHQKIKQYLNKRLQKFDLILSWEPPEENICPSSVAKFLSDIGYNIQVCSPKFEIRAAHDVKMPCISKKRKEFPISEIVEWLGMFSLGADITSGSFDSYTNTYECPENRIAVKDVVYLEWRGLFTIHQTQLLYSKLTNYLSTNKCAPWISFYVQGFSDTPVAWKTQEHQYVSNGDDAFVFFMEPSGQYLLYTKTSSNKRPKHKF